MTDGLRKKAPADMATPVTVIRRGVPLPGVVDTSMLPTIGPATVGVTVMLSAHEAPNGKAPTQPDADSPAPLGWIRTAVVAPMFVITAVAANEVVPTLTVPTSMVAGDETSTPVTASAPAVQASGGATTVPPEPPATRASGDSAPPAPPVTTGRVVPPTPSFLAASGGGAASATVTGRPPAPVAPPLPSALVPPEAGPPVVAIGAPPAPVAPAVPAPPPSAASGAPGRDGRPWLVQPARARRNQK